MSARNPAALTWSDSLVTGDARIDGVHQEFVALANALLEAGDAELLRCLQAFKAHAVEHFGEEDRLMRDSAYPSAGCHLEEHAAVLASVDEVIALVAGGNTFIGRDLAQELVRWFPEHTEEMDKGLVRWLVRRSTGGAPLVFHRAGSSY